MKAYKTNNTVGAGNNAFSSIVVVLLLLSCGPFFIIGGQSTIINLFVVALYLILFGYFFSKKLNSFRPIITRRNLNILIGSVLFFVVLFFPFREYDRMVAVILWPLVFLTYLLLDEGFIDLIAKGFSNSIFYISFLVIFIWLLLFLGVPVPSWEYSTGLVGVNKSTFIVFPGTAVLQGQDFDLYGKKVFRMSGLFSEPGHFGIICFFGYLMAVELSKYKRIVIVIASVLSFSLGTYILWGGYFLVSKAFNFKKKIILLLFVFITVFIAFQYLPDEVAERFFLNKINSGETLDSRTGDNFIAFVNRDHDLLTRFKGYGRLVFEEYNMSSSDYRGFFIRFGLIGVISYFLWIVTIAFNGTRKNIFLIFLISLIIFLHRSWLIDYFILYFILYYCSKKEKL